MTSAVQPNRFDPVRTELLNGINLIEASAGTGKTYAIAMLVLRFVVEREIAIDQLLVVTFTQAATQELRDRIRARLAEARQAATGKRQGVDANVLAWLDGLAVEADLIRRRLELALLDIDRAGIFTIHGFCQRILKEHALESGQPFDAELTGDVAEIKQACADDFWRAQVYRRTPWEASLLTAQYRTPDALLASVDAIDEGIEVFPECVDLDAQLAEIKCLAQTAQGSIDAAANAVRARFSEGTFKDAYIKSFESHYQALSAWLQGTSPAAPASEAFDLFTLSGLGAGLNGQKFRKTQQLSAEQRKADYLNDLALDTDSFERLAEAYRKLGVTLRRSLLACLRRDLDLRLQRLNLMSFDALIGRLAQALRGDQAGLLIAALRLRFRAALIDEFQDTDQNQWFIFASLFA